MLRFRFRARTQKGVLRKGIVEAQTLQAAAEVVRGQDLVIVELHQVDVAGGGLTIFND